MRKPVVVNSQRADSGLARTGADPNGSPMRSRFPGSWLSSPLPCESCLRRGTAIVSASAVISIRSVVHNRPFGVDRGDRGMNCMWGVHKLPRPPARSPVGSFCMTAGGPQPRPRALTQGSPRIRAVRGTGVDSQLRGLFPVFSSSSPFRSRPRALITTTPGWEQTTICGRLTTRPRYAQPPERGPPLGRVSGGFPRAA